MDLLTSSTDLLAEVGFTVGRISINGREALVFEDATVLGFLVAYGDPSELARLWKDDASHAIVDHQFGLRRAAQKAWNAYFVSLTTGDVDHSHSVALAAIEEDLGGMRKIARGGIKDRADLRAALLTLLPLQSAPRLGAVDIVAEIRQRATEVDSRVVDAFLSTAEEGVVIQILEEAT